MEDTSRMVTPLRPSFFRALANWCGDWSIIVIFSGLTPALTTPRVQNPVL